jgi:hypothetical protein
VRNHIAVSTVTQSVVEYESYGQPLESYELTRADHRAQREHEETTKCARQWAANSPAWSDEQWKAISALLSHSRDSYVPPPQMRWRVRPYCGHTTEIVCDATRSRPYPPYQQGYRDERCRECDGREQIIVAFEPVGPTPQPRNTTRPNTGKTPTRRKADLEAENAALRAEVERLRAISGGDRGA